MQASVESFRAQNRDLKMVMREVDEDVAIFLGMRNRVKERINSHILIQDSDHVFDQSIGGPATLVFTQMYQLL